jgi:hypothetical protein
MENLLGMLGIDAKEITKLEKTLKHFVMLEEQNNLMLKALMETAVLPERAASVKRGCDIIEAKYRQ